MEGAEMGTGEPLIKTACASALCLGGSDGRTLGRGTGVWACVVYASLLVLNGCQAKNARGTLAT